MGRQQTPERPRIWNVPHLRNPNFTGREEILRQLRERLTSGGSAVVNQAIRGLGGIGKTQLAVEYAYRNLESYEAVWWLRSEEPTTLSGDYAALASELDLPEKGEQDQSKVVGAVRRWLERNTGWLLIFDNSNRPEDLREYLPRVGQGHVLITSRFPHWRGVTEPLPLNEMSSEEAVDFLIKRTGNPGREDAGSLSEALGHLPLALEQAAAYIEANGLDYSAYLERFEKYRKEMLRRGELSTDYPHSVATTWEISFEAVSEECPAAADLLNLCAFFAPEDIPLGMIIAGEDYLTEPLRSTVTYPLKMDGAIRTLLSYSLITVTSDALSIHRLVQVAVRERMSEEERKKLAEMAVSCASS